MKDALEFFANQIHEATEGGTLDPLEVYVSLKAYADEVNALLKSEDLRKAVEEEVALHGKEATTKSGLKVAVSQRARYSFKHVPQWEALKAQLQDVEALSKTAAQKGGFIADANGEEIAPARATYSTTITVTKPRK